MQFRTYVCPRSIKQLAFNPNCFSVFRMPHQLNVNDSYLCPGLDKTSDMHVFFPFLWSIGVFLNTSWRSKIVWQLEYDIVIRREYRRISIFSKHWLLKLINCFFNVICWIKRIV